MKRKLATLIGSLCLVLAAAEIITRILLPRPLHPAHGLLRVLPHDPLLFEYIPGARVDDVAINSSGFRDDEYPAAKDTGEYRIVWIGDSIVMGWGVNKENRFTDVITRSLNRRHAPVRSCNLAVESYSNYQELITLQRKGVRLQPDAIVLGFCWNDILKYEHFIDSSGRNKFSLDTSRAIPAAKGSLLHRLRTMVLRYSAFGAYVRQAVLNILSGQADQAALFGHFFNWYAAAWASPQADTLYQQINSMAALARDHHAQFIVVLFPMSFQIERSAETEAYAARADSTMRLLKSKLSGMTIRTYDAADDLRAGAARKGRSLYLDVWHFTDEGHAQAAAGIGGYLEQALFHQEAPAR